MNQKQKMRDMILGAVIMLVGMILGAARRMAVKTHVQTPTLWRNFSNMHNGNVK